MRNEEQAADVVVGQSAAGMRIRPQVEEDQFPGVESPTVAPFAEDLSSVAEQAVAATVEIRCGDGSGAGVIIHPDGLVLTARHVVHDDRSICRDVPVRLADGKRLRGSVFRSHWPVDLALLWLDRDGPFAFLPLGNPRALRVAQPLIAVGHPSELSRDNSRRTSRTR